MTGAASPPKFSAFESLNFRYLWLGLLISNAGTWMESTGSGWLVTDLEPARKALWLGIIAAAFAVPMLTLTPFGGVLADRFSKLKLLWTVQITYFVCSGLLAILTLTDVVNVWWLIGYSFINGAVLAIDSPVRHSILPDLVSREQLTSAVSLNSASFQGAALVGPAIAGALIPLIGVAGVFMVNTCSCLATLWALTKLTNLPEHAHAHPGGMSPLESIKRGVAFVMGDPLVRGLLGLSLITGFFSRSFSPLLAVFARDEFKVGSFAFGILLAAGGLGALIGAFGLASRGAIERRGYWQLVAVAAQAGFLFLFAVCPWYPASLPLLVGVGIATAVSAALTATLIQLAAPPALRGRIMSLYILAQIGVPSIGSLAAGAMGDLIGVREAVGIGAAIVIVATAITFVRIPAMRAAT
jgi:MFS family permease